MHCSVNSLGSSQTTPGKQKYNGKYCFGVQLFACILGLCKNKEGFIIPLLLDRNHKQTCHSSSHGGNSAWSNPRG